MIIQKPLSFPNLHFQGLRKICHTKPAILAKQFGLTEVQTPKGKYWFKDNNADILGVSHLDSVLPFLHFDVTRLRMDTLIYCSTLDNRLGTYILLDWLEKAGAKYDILLTEGEEQGESTAKYFKPPKHKDYNWTFSFDRKGTDVAVYQYYSPSFAQAILAQGAENVVHGTYSDIADLEHLGCRGLNFGIGFHGEHTNYAYAHKSEIIGGLRRFQSFYREYKSIAFPFESEKYLTGAKEEIKPLAAKEHKTTSEKSKIELIREFKERRRRAEEANRPNIAAMEALLQQNISFLPLQPATLNALYESGIYLIKDMVKHSRIELLKYKPITALMIKDIEAKIQPVGLTFAMSLKAFNLPVSTLKVVIKEPEKGMGEIHRNVILALSSAKAKATISDGIPLIPSKAIIAHPKAQVPDAAVTRGSEDQLPLFPDEIITLVECPHCNTMYAQEDIDSEHGICKHCTSELVEAGVNQTGKVFADSSCLRCGDTLPLDDLDENLHCVKCLEEIQKEEDKKGTIMRAAFKLTRDIKDDTHYLLTKEGFKWVSVSPAKEMYKETRVGFQVKPE